MIRAAHEQTEIDSVKKDLYEKRSDLADLFIYVVPPSGFEPLRHFCHGILSPACLPVSPRRHGASIAQP